MDDYELLREYLQSRSQSAFGQLIERHLGMVYSTAQRMVRDVHLAEEVAQSAFATLAEKAAEIRPPHVLGGWLYNTTRHLAMHAVRTEQRRRKREEAAIAVQSLEANVEANQIVEQLEPAMAELEPGERDVLVLRYLENRSLRDVGAQHGISEDAARMRVNRALEHLRTIFARQGMAVSALSLSAVLASNASSAVPMGLAAAITAAALPATAASTAASATTQAVMTTMNWINVKTAAAIACTAILAGTGAYLVQNRRVEHLRAENQALIAAQETPRANQQSAVASAQVKDDDEIERLRKDAGDVLRLRNEIVQLRRERDEAQRQRAETRAQLAPLREAEQARAGAKGASEEIIPKGAIWFGNVEAHRVLVVYAELANAEWDPDPAKHKHSSLLRAPITFANEEDLTREDALRLLEEAFREQAGFVVSRRTGIRLTFPTTGETILPDGTELKSAR
jgi:RNA polymerase sigma factor (sigma-70 family)